MFKERIAHLRGVTPSRVESMVKDVMIQNSDVAIELNQSQLWKGQTSTGRKIRKYRSKSYAKFKLGLNPLGVTDLKLTGSFWGKMYMDGSVFPPRIDSSDKKRDEIVDNYGEDIFGIQSKNLGKYLEVCKPGIQQGYRSLLRL